MKKTSLALALMAITSGVSAEIGYLETTNSVTFKGEIEKGFAEEIKSHIESKGADSLIIQSNGGNISEAIDLGSYLRMNKITTYAPSNCASACVMVFAGGHDRIVSYDTKMGIHAFSNPNSNEVSPTDLERTTQVWATMITLYYNELGIDSNLAMKASVTPSDDMYWMTLGEMKGWGLASHVLEDSGVSADKVKASPVANTPVKTSVRSTKSASSIPEVVFKGNWKPNKNTAGVLKQERYLDGIGVRFVHHSDDVGLTICTDRPEFANSQNLKVKMVVNGGNGLVRFENGIAVRAKRAKSCWDVEMTKNPLREIKNGDAMGVRIDGPNGSLIYKTPLTGSALAINKAWAYKERKMLDK